MADRRDWTLLAIASANGDPITPVQLQKTLFLLQRDLPHDVGGDFYSFRPYHYGPFDAAIYGDAEELARDGSIEISPRPGHPRRTYRVTPEGVTKAGRFDVSPRARQHLRELVAWAQRLSFAQLVSAVYQRAPETRANSVFRG